MVRTMRELDSASEILTAHQHGGPREEEAVALLHGEELEHEDHERDDREDDGEDHEGLHCLERICGHRVRRVGCQADQSPTGRTFPQSHEWSALNAIAL